MKTQILEQVRAIKNKKELADIVKAQRISESVLHDVKQILKTGITEIEVANFIKKSFLKKGVSILSFEPIVAFGKGSADIHHEPTKNKLRVGDIIMFDFGATVNHYCSDMTRTFFWGEPNAKQKKLYQDVLKAMDMALGMIGKGEKDTGKIDKASRSFLAKKYKDNFRHGLGHGVGTAIHEWPHFRPNSKDLLKPGMVMTVEPGIYLKDLGGVRIEDMILITKTGYINLTKVPKTLESAVLK